MKSLKEYAICAVLETSYEEAVIKAIDVLKEEGFGVLTEIDVKAALKKKLDIDSRRFLIVGAFDPSATSKALQADPDIGLLFPNNIIIYERDDRNTVVAVLDPISAGAMIRSAELRHAVVEVSGKLRRVIERLSQNRWIGFHEIDPTIDELVKNLAGSDESLRIHSRESLVKIGKPAVPQLIEALKRGNHWLRWEAAKALGEIADPTAAPALVDAFEDDESDVRWLAAEALIKIKSGAIEPVLHALMVKGDFPRVKEGAHQVIRELMKGSLKEYLVPVHASLDGIQTSIQLPWAAWTAHERLIEAGVIHHTSSLPQAPGQP